VSSAVFDTNILIDFTLGVPGAAVELRVWTPKLISTVSWMEVLVGAQDPNDDLRLHQFLERFTLIRLSDSLAERAVRFGVSMASSCPTPSSTPQPSNTTSRS
jgi:predicted nucleic acid-binding protein